LFARIRSPLAPEQASDWSLPSADFVIDRSAPESARATIGANANTLLRRVSTNTASLAIERPDGECLCSWPFMRSPPFLEQAHPVTRSTGLVGVRASRRPRLLSTDQAIGRGSQCPRARGVA